MNLYEFLRDRSQRKCYLATVLVALATLLASAADAEPSFSIEMNGRRTASLNGPGLVRKVASGAILTLEAGRDGDLVLISLPKTLRPGSYKLDSWSGEIEGGKSRHFGVSYSNFRSSHGEPAAKFESMIEGVLEVDSISPLSGTFSCVLDGGLEGIVRIKGSLNALPYPVPDDPQNGQRH